MLRQVRRRLRRLPFVLLICTMLLGLWPASDLTARGYYDTRLGMLSGPQSFSLTLWTIGAIAGKTWQVTGLSSAAKLAPEERQKAFDEFFATTDEANRLEGEIAGLANQGVKGADPRLADKQRQLQTLRQKRAEQSHVVESILEDQVRQILEQENVAVARWGRLLIPPVFSKLIDLPHVLIVAHRDRFEMRTQVAMRRSITTDETTTLEVLVDEDLKVSSLLVPIGGYSTYPTMIAGTAPLDFVIGAITHEWCHIYLTFRPLGLSYGKSGEVTAMNETVCGLFGDDTAALVRETFYGAAKEPRPWQATPTPTAPPSATQPPRRDEPQGFNVNRELRKIYLQAEERLKAGDIGGAEAVMDEGRRYLADNGFHLRKLNQAFFAFYGSYAEGPNAIRPDPIGEDLRALRRRSATLRDFMLAVEQMTTYDDLKRALGKQE